MNPNPNPMYPTPPQSNWPQRPPRNTALAWVNAHRIITGVIVLLLACCACGGLATAINGATNSDSNTGGTGAATATTAQQTPQATSAPTATPRPKAWKTIQHFTGATNQQTPTFHLNDGDRIVWSATPQDASGANLIIIDLYNSDGSIVDQIVDNANSNARLSSTYNVHGDGDVYLNIQADTMSYDISVQRYE